MAAYPGLRREFLTHKDFVCVRRDSGTYSRRSRPTQGLGQFSGPRYRRSTRTVRDGFGQASSINQTQRSVAASERATCNFGHATKESPMNSTQRNVLAFSRVLVAMIFLLNGLGIISQAVAAKELVEHGAPASLVPFLILAARTLEIVAGLGLIFGIYPRLAALGF